MSVSLHPWRPLDGAPDPTTLLLWQRCETDESLRRAREAIPADGAIVAVDVEAPDRIPGLDFRERTAHERVLTAWLGPADDPPLRALAESLTPPATFDDPVLGRLAWDARLRLYGVRRSMPSVQASPYDVRVEPTVPHAPAVDVDRARRCVVAVEAAWPSIRLEVAGRLHLDDGLHVVDAHLAG